MSESQLLLGLLALVIACAGYLFYAWRTAEASCATAQQKLAASAAKLEQIEAMRGERDASVAQRDAVANELALVRAELAAERSARDARVAAADDKERALIEMKAEVEKTFLTLAHQALSQSEQRFLNLANETFEKHKTSAAGGVKEVVTPVQEQFAKLAETIAALDKARTEDKSALAEQMRQVAETLAQTQSTTGKLVNALRAAPKARGRWGEETLRNVLEMSGLTQKIDFHEQPTHDSDEGKLRPDVVISLPGNRCIVVDSKVALSAYFDALETTDDVARDALMKKHASEMRQHVRQLSSKDYQKNVPQTADFVVMFVPGENFLAAAFEHDSALFQDASALRVILVGPSSLLALAKSIAYGWRQEEVGRNAENIAKLGAELYERLAIMSERLSAHGASLEKARTTYNDLVTTTEARVLVSARRFKELGAGGDSGREVQPPETLDTPPRLPLGLPEPDAGKAKRGRGA